MQNRTIGFVATVITALACGCASLFSCIWGFFNFEWHPINVTSNGTTNPQTFSPVIGYTLLCVSVILILIPVAVGFFTLRKKPEPVDVNVPV